MNTTPSTPAQVDAYLAAGGTGTSREIAEALGLPTKKVSTVLSRFLKGDYPVVKEDGVFSSTAVEPVVEPEPEVEAEPVVEDDEDFDTRAVIDFPGNYSIVFAPGAAKMAAAAGVRTKIVNVPGKLNRQVFFEDTDAADVVRLFINREVPNILAALKVWQKENIETRRGLTDMQRYLQHRDFIATQMDSLANYIAKEGVEAL